MDFINGYYRAPTIMGERLVFVSEDDLWLTTSSGGMARRLSAGVGRVATPSLSPSGEWLAFTSTEESHFEVFLMPSCGGEARRMTYLGCDTAVIGWREENEILFASNHEQAFGRITELYALDTGSHQIKKLACGPANHISLSGDNSAGTVKSVIARHGGSDPAYWKRYRGGRVGQIWIDRLGDGAFSPLVSIGGNTARPFWIKERIFFISDHEGIGNIYSVDERGADLRRHSASRDFYVRGLSVDSQNKSKIVYHAGGDIFVFDTAGPDLPEEKRKLKIDYCSPRTQINRRFVAATDYLEDYEMHPNGEKAVIAARGKTFSFELWKGPVFQHGQEGAMRFRLGRFMRDGQRVVLVSDEGGEESLEIHDAGNRKLSERLLDLNLGRTLEMKLSPTDDLAALVNHRNELILVDLVQHTSRVLDRSEHARIYGFNWSHDGQWIAYSRSEGERQSAIYICNTQTYQKTRVTQPVLRDVSPFFDPNGDCLYFISYREFDPVYDNLHFDLSFPRGCKPYLITLRKDVLSPFSVDHSPKKEKTDSEKSTKERPERLKIDFDGIEDRIVAFPLAEGRYGQIAATKEKFFFTRLPIDGSLRSERFPDEPLARAHLEMFDFKTEKTETLISGITSFRLAQDGKHILYRAGNTLRLIKSSERPKDTDFSKSGWLDLERVQIPVQPRSEWSQMYREAWRLQRDHFWTETMSKVDWERVYQRYLPLLERVGSRSEVSDLLWEMQGELGTSHAYESGGDYRPEAHYGIGFLGAEFEFDRAASAFRITRVMKGDIWDEKVSSPLARAGLGLKAGDHLIAIDGQPLAASEPVHKSLVNCGGRDISVSFRRQGESEIITRSVRTLRSEQRLRYREWVEAKRKAVFEASSGRLGYIHIPNMGPHGYAEFHRSFLTELDRDGLVIDVRFNGGGDVSQLLLEKLARRRIGYSKSRWFGIQPYPDESPAGAMVAITNEYAGSDGDIFSHSFKLLNLGPLIGKRTWGGVIGINPSHSLADGGHTTQPEYSFWFEDVGWKVENYGTEPDIEVEIPPQAFVAGEDPQLAEAIRVCLKNLAERPPKPPRFEEGPDLSLPAGPFPR